MEDQEITNCTWAVRDKEEDIWWGVEGGLPHEHDFTEGHYSSFCLKKKKEPF